jgi:hypothetical protein
MSYLTQNEIATNQAMLARVAQAAAQEKVATDPDRWTYEKRRSWASAPGWSEAWEYSKNTHPPVDGEPAYDPGTNEAVITDGQILAQVQAMKPPTPPGMS